MGALGVSVFLEELSTLLAADLGLSSDMVLYAVNESGMIALHSDTDMVMGNSSALDVPDEAVSETSTLLGWTFTLGVEE